MGKRALIGVLALVGGLLVAEWAGAAAPPWPKGMPPKGVPAPPPPPMPGRARCSLCNGTGRRFYGGRWHTCTRCGGSGWVSVGPPPPPPRPSGHHSGRWGWRGRDRDPCFVATAAYGAAWDSHVATLRGFRDQCLLQSPVGQGFVALYYAASPPLAHWIADRPWARAATRAALTPVVTVAGALTGNCGDLAIVGGTIALVFLGVPRLRRAVKRRRASA